MARIYPALSAASLHRRRHASNAARPPPAPPRTAAACCPPVPPQARVERIDAARQRAHAQPRAVQLPRHGRDRVHVGHLLDPRLLPQVAPGRGEGEGGREGAGEGGRDAVTTMSTTAHIATHRHAAKSRGTLQSHEARCKVTRHAAKSRGTAPSRYGVTRQDATSRHEVRMQSRGKGTGC
eukprot:2758439-Rhodomonas_salina.1